MKVITKIGIFSLILGLILLISGIVILEVRGETLGGFNMGKTTSFTDTLDETDIDNIEIDINFSELIIEKGDAFTLKAENVYEKYASHLTNNGNTAVIKAENKMKSMFGLEKSITSSGTYTLTVPEKIYNEINCTLSFCDTNISALKADKMFIDASFSDIDCSTFEVYNNLKLDTSFSDFDISLENEEIEEVYIDNSFGDFDFNADIITDFAEIDNSFGDCTISLKEGNYNVISDSSFGDISSDVSTEFNADTKTVNIKVDNSFGSIDITTER